MARKPSGDEKRSGFSEIRRKAYIQTLEYWQISQREICRRSKVLYFYNPGRFSFVSPAQLSLWLNRHQDCFGITLETLECCLAFPPDSEAESYYEKLVTDAIDYRETAMDAIRYWQEHKGRSPELDW